MKVKRLPKQTCSDTIPADFRQCRNVKNYPKRMAKVFYNHITKEVFDKDKNFMGFGDLINDEKGLRIEWK